MEASKPYEHIHICIRCQHYFECFDEKCYTMTNGGLGYCDDCVAFFDCIYGALFGEGEVCHS